MISTQSFVILLIHLASLIFCVDSHPTPDPSGSALHTRTGRKGTPVDNKTASIVFGCFGGLCFVGFMIGLYSGCRESRPADPDPGRPSTFPLAHVVWPWTRWRTNACDPEIVPATSIALLDKDDGDEEGVPQRPKAEV